MKKILESYLGRLIIIKKIAKNHPNYEETDQSVASKLAKEVNEYFITYACSENLDQANDQFAKTIAGRNNILSNHCFDNAKDISKELKKNSGNSRNSHEKGSKKKEEETVSFAFT